MLFSLALFSIVNGALAFKARFQKNYCVTWVFEACDAMSGLKWPNLFSKSKQSFIGVNAFCTTTVPPGGCRDSTACTTDQSISLIRD
jgi:hypothetical protein